MTALVLPSRVTLAEARAAAGDLIAKLEASANGEAQGDLVIDASGVRAFDSSAFAVMLEVARKAGGRAVKVHGAPASMVALAQLYGVDDLLSF